MASRRTLKVSVLLPSLFGLLIAIGSIGCNKQDGSAASGQADATLISAGKAAFATNGCGGCHGNIGQGGGRAPDLSHVGGEPSHTSEWIVQHIKNPKSQNPNSRMPAFEGRIKDADLQALGAYLSNLK